MTNSIALRDWITRKGYKLKAIAEKLGIIPYSLQKKIDNESEFKASEIATFVNDLGMDTPDRDEIFFARNVE